MVNVKSVEIEFQAHHILYALVSIGLLIGFASMYQELQLRPATGLSIMDFIGGNELYGDIEKQITDEFIKVTESPFFVQGGTLITFFYSMTPSFIPIPNEILMTPIVLAEQTQEAKLNQAIFLILITSIGGFIGDFAVFLLAKRHVHKLIKSEKRDELESNHWFHRFGVVMFLFTPSLWFAGGGAEVSLVLGGYAQLSSKRVAPFLFGGNLIRGIWGGLIFISVLGLL